MRNVKPVWRGLLLLVVGALIGYGIGLGLDFAVQRVISFQSPVAGLFSLLIGATLFFFGLIGYRGVTRGLTFQVLGTLIGAGLITAIRAIMGLDLFGAFLFTEPAWVVGGLVGTISFMAGIGALTDWWKWALG